MHTGAHTSTSLFAVTCVVVPAEDRRLALLPDVKNPVCVFSDGHVGAACRDGGGGFVAGVVFQTPQTDAGSCL